MLEVGLLAKLGKCSIRKEFGSALACVTPGPSRHALSVAPVLVIRPKRCADQHANQLSDFGRSEVGITVPELNIRIKRVGNL